MIHVPALPGTYRNTLSISTIENFCLHEADTLVNNGITNIIVENYGDVPFPKDHVHPHVISALTRVLHTIRSKYRDTVKLGVNVLRNDAYSAMGIASICNCSMIRVNVLTHARLTDQGLIEGKANELKQYQQLLGSSVEIWADIEVKHSVAITPISIQDLIKDTLERAGADKIILTGNQTGQAVDISILQKIVSKKMVSPEQIVIGSGVTSKNFSSLVPFANHFIVGSSLKKDGIVTNPIDPVRVQRLVKAFSSYSPKS
jgi:membrane complex biogenesis BtpA family protein